MGLFQQVEGEAAILIERGVYKQTSIYTRNGFLYAKLGSGFVRLMYDGSTTKASCRLETLTWSLPLFMDKMGRLCTPDMEGATALPEPREQKLLGLAK